MKFLGLSFIAYILYEIEKFLSNSEIVHVQASKALHHLVGMTVQAPVLKKKNDIISQIHDDKKRLYSDPRPKSIQFFLW